MGMYHTAAQDLDPARALAETASLSAAFEAAHIHLRAWLREREMMGTEFRLCLRPEQLLCEYLQGSFQIREGNMLVNDQSLNLMEGRRVGSIHFVGTEYPAWRDHSDRQLSLLHDTCLHRGGLGTQHNIFINIESILLVLCRMIRRNIQFFKIIQVVFHLRPFHNLISHSHEDPLHLFQGDGVGMPVADAVLLRRQRHVDDLGFELLLADHLLHFLLCLFHDRFDGGPRLVHKLAHLRAFLRRNILHPFEYGGQLPLLPKEPHAYVIEPFRHIRCLDLRDGFFFDLFQSVFHSGFSFLRCRQYSIPLNVCCSLKSSF